MGKERTIEYLDSLEVKALLDSPYKTNLRDRLILRFLASTGVRVTEMLNVTWKEVSLTLGQEQIRIYTLKKRKKDKEGNWVPRKEVRAIPLIDSTLIDMLRRYRPDDYEPEGEPFDLSRQAVTAMVKRYAARAGIVKNAYSHILRHSFAVSCLKLGVDLRTLQRLLGHSNINQTAKYLLITTVDIQEKMKELGSEW